MMPTTKAKATPAKATKPAVKTPAKKAPAKVAVKATAAKATTKPAVKATPAKAPAKAAAPRTLAVKLGDAVEYVSTRGKTKLAFVLGTEKTVEDGTRIPTLTKGQLHLMVFNLNGSANARYNVPSEASVKGNVDFQIDGKPAGVWRRIK